MDNLHITVENVRYCCQIVQEAHVYGQQKKKPRIAGRESSVALEGVKGPAFLAEAEANGFQEIPEFVCLPLTVVDVSGPLVVNRDEVIRRVTGNPPGVGTTGEDLGFGCCSGHMCDS